MADGNVDSIIQACDTSLTVFLGGAGMAGPYNDEFMAVFREAGICNPVYGNFSGLGFTDGGVLGIKEVDMVGDAASVIFYNDADKWQSGTTEIISDPSSTIIMKNGEVVHISLNDAFTLAGIGVAKPVPEKQDRFNIIGYSWGAVIACLTARYHSLAGHEVDCLVLIGAPVNQSLLDLIENDPNIKQVIIKNLTEFGDPLYAGMSDNEIIAAVPNMATTMSSQSGHFYYSGAGTSETMMRKRKLVVELLGRGLK